MQQQVFLSRILRADVFQKFRKATTARILCQQVLSTASAQPLAPLGRTIGPLQFTENSNEATTSGSQWRGREEKCTSEIKVVSVMLAWTAEVNGKSEAKAPGEIAK